MTRDEGLYRKKVEEMVRVYREVSPGCWLQKEASRKVVTHKASSFFILPHTAYNALHKVFYGYSDKIDIKNENTRRMYEELYRRVLRMSTDPAYVGCTLLALCEIAVNEEAPEFYVSAETFRGILSRERARMRKGGRNAIR